jgi:hypothetical protein
MILCGFREGILSVADGNSVMTIRFQGCGKGLTNVDLIIHNEHMKLGIRVCRHIPDDPKQFRLSFPFVRPDQITDSQNMTGDGRDQILATGLIIKFERFIQCEELEVVMMHPMSNRRPRA